MIKAIRGAITCTENTAESISENTCLLLQEMMAANDLQKEQLIQVIFSATRDLTAAYPAKFARTLGWTDVPLFCVQEMAVDGSLMMVYPRPHDCGYRRSCSQTSLSQRSAGAAA